MSDIFDRNKILNNIQEDLKIKEKDRKITINLDENKRYFHQHRTVDERKKDEKSTEIITNNLTRWKNNPIKYDMKHIDDKINEKIILEEIIDGNAKDYYFAIREKPNEKVKKKLIDALGGKEKVLEIWQGDDESLRHLVADKILGLSKAALRFSTNGYINDSDIYINSIKVSPKYRKKGYASYLLREMTNFLDDNCLRGNIYASAFKFDEDDDIENLMPTEKLIDLYASFGFDKISGRYQYRDISKECKLKNKN
jgi:ribosomal protein S18 acetylase RimI-like enzyme